MPARDILQRFRPAGAPGSAGPVGVPADAARRRTRELDLVFEALAATIAECQAIREAGEREAGEIEERAEQDARRIAVEARLRAADQRADAAAQVRQDADRQADEAIGTARREAAELLARGRPRIEALAARVAALVRAGPP